MKCSGAASCDVVIDKARVGSTESDITCQELQLSHPRSSLFKASKQARRLSAEVAANTEGYTRFYSCSEYPLPAAS